MSRSQHKIAFIGYEMFIKCFQKKKKNVFFYQRHSLVPFFFGNEDLEIHQGKTFKSYCYRKAQFGLKLGEFARTRSPGHHRGKRVKIKKKRQKVYKARFSYNLKDDFFTR